MQLAEVFHTLIKIERLGSKSIRLQITLGIHKWTLNRSNARIIWERISEYFCLVQGAFIVEA